MTANDIVRKVGPALSLLAVLLGLLVWQRAGQAGPPVIPLAPDPAAGTAPSDAASHAAHNELLRAAFNRDWGKVRLLLLLDPT